MLHHTAKQLQHFVVIVSPLYQEAFRQPCMHVLETSLQGCLVMPCSIQCIIDSVLYLRHAGQPNGADLPYLEKVAFVSAHF